MKAIFNGNDAGGQPAMDCSMQASNEPIAAAAETYADRRFERFSALVDGQYAYDMGRSSGRARQRHLCGLRGPVRAMVAMDRSSTTFAMHLGSIRVSNRVPARTPTRAQKGLVTLNGALVPLRIPTWMGVEIIVDPYSQCRQGHQGLHGDHACR